MSIFAILSTGFAFGLMIFIHELGHYLAAIRVGVRVEKFYLGFDFWGLKLFKYTYKGTEYGIGIFPLGGYVKLAGQEDFGKADVKGKDDEFTSKTVWERIQILIGGVVFNFLSAFIFSALAIYAGYKLISPELGRIVPGSPAWEVGLEEGDKVLKYGYVPIQSFSDLQTEVALGGTTEQTLVYERNGERKEIQVVPMNGPMGIPMLGAVPQDTLIIKGIGKDTPAAKAGFMINDEIISINGTKINTWSEISPLINEVGVKGIKAEVTVKRNSETVTLSVEPIMRKRPFIGIMPSFNPEVIGIQKSSTLFKAGINKGDKLKTINGFKSLLDFQLSDQQNSALLDLTFTTKQNKEVSLKYTGNSDQFFKECIFNIENSPIIIQKVIPNSVAQSIGLKAADQITLIRSEDQTYEKPTWSQLLVLVSKSGGKKFDLEVLRNGETLKLSGVIGDGNPNEYMLGINNHYKELENTNLKTALMWPFHMLRVTYKSVVSLISGKVSAEHISGPIGIVRVTYQVAEHGLADLLYLMAMISINLAFLNILPLPVLDGGHVLFCIIEGIKGSPLSEAFMHKMQFIGIVLLLSLFMFATWNDLTKLTL